MKKLNISSTKLKRNTAEILNLVAYGELTAIVKRYGEPLVKITPIISLKKDSNLKTKLKKYFGAIPDFPSVSKKRYFRKYKFNL